MNSTVEVGRKKEACKSGNEASNVLTVEQMAAMNEGSMRENWENDNVGYKSYFSREGEVDPIVTTVVERLVKFTIDSLEGRNQLHGPTTESGDTHFDIIMKEWKEENQMMGSVQYNSGCMQYPVGCDAGGNMTQEEKAVRAEEISKIVKAQELASQRKYWMDDFSSHEKYLSSKYEVYPVDSSVVVRVVKFVLQSLGERELLQGSSTAESRDTQLDIITKDWEENQMKLAQSLKQQREENMLASLKEMDAGKTPLRQKKYESRMRIEKLRNKNRQLDGENEVKVKPVDTIRHEFADFVAGNYIVSERQGPINPETRESQRDMILKKWEETKDESDSE